MSDDNPNGNDDPLQSNEIAAEAFEVSDDEAASESEEGMNVEALSRSFESYVRNYQDAWQQAWQESIDTYKQDIENWQTMIANFPNTTPKPQAQPTKTPPATKAKPSKSRS